MPANDKLQVPPRLLTRDQAADLLNVSPRTLQQLTRDGHVPYVPMGDRLVRYDPLDIEAWLASGREARLARLNAMPATAEDAEDEPTE